MKLILRSAGSRPFHLLLPNGLALNGLTAAILSRCLSSHGVTVTGQQLRTLRQELKRFRRLHKDWVLVEVESADGEYVKIQL